MEIAEQIKNLSVAEKETLIIEIRRQIRQFNQEGFVELILPVSELEDICCSIVGIDHYDEGKRDRKNVCVAILMTYYLLDKKMKECHIGAYIGKDESTIYHYRNILNTWYEFPDIYADEMNYLNELKKRLGHETD